MDSWVLRFGRSVVIAVWGLLFCMCGSSEQDRELARALYMAGDNRAELEHVLAHFKGDSLKLEAAKFLICNMPGHYSYADTAIVNRYSIGVGLILERMKGADSKAIAAAINRLAAKMRMDTLQIVSDVRVVTAGYLIRNIDEAFKRWRDTPWAQHLLFDEFCEYILPYKAAELQPLTEWHNDFYYYNAKYLADYACSEDTRNSTYKAAQIFNYYLSLKFDPRFTHDVLNCRALSPSVAIRIPFGNCSSFSQSALSAFRSVGLPVVRDVSPVWAGGNGSHVWNSMLTNTGRLLPFVGITDKLEEQQMMNNRFTKVWRQTYAVNQELVRINREEKFVPAFFRNVFQKDVTDEYTKCRDMAFDLNVSPVWAGGNGSHVWNSMLTNTGRLLPFVGITDKLEEQQMMNNRFTKVWRQTYAVNQELVRINREEKFVPAFFRNVFQKDVTDEYTKCRDMAFDLKGNDGYVYLAASDAAEWVPVDVTYMKAGHAEFRNVAPGAVYMVVLYGDDGTMQALTAPFVANRAGTPEYLLPGNVLHTVTLTRKYPVRESTWIYSRMLVGGAVEAADDEAFASARTVYEIPNASAETCEVDVSDSIGARRYWRFRSGHVTSLVPLAELAFYDRATGRRLTGRIIGTGGSWADDPEHTAEKAFDGDLLTSYSAPVGQGAWIGLDFGRPVDVGRVRYTSRGDGNCVEPGDEYELLYWADGAWQTLGKKQALGVGIKFDNVPAGALYLLVDRTKGVEHRIFTYADVRQHFR
ncbi:discoidin domain-containing protein [uncultured Muribaculum sp.]|uniref:discoidin domain-containing protein n=1 Tax=uncultured Muribaculum sp. TaxID=1918613 RepID=UPI0026702F00|nr:discoidin domain-containing protein [uncultured Muribaculum sp.]